MADYKLGGLYTVQNKEEARQFIGKEGFFSDVYGILINDRFLSNKQKPAVLEEISEDDCLPFRNETSSFQFFRPIIEDEEKLMRDYKVGILYDPDNKYKAEQYLGKKGFFSNHYPEITDFEK